MMATSPPEAPHKEYVYGSDEVFQNICDLCIQDNQSVEAKAFCTVCMQYLCTTCHKSHTRANATKNHNILTGKDMPASQRSKLRLKPSCSKHLDKLLESLCYDHKSVCCGKCKILDHRYCKNLIKLSELSLKENSEEENELKMESLNILLNEFKRLKSVSETLKSDLESKRKDMIKTIKESRKRIDDKLDRLEADMITKVDKEMDAGGVEIEKQKNEINCLMDELQKQVNKHEDTLKSGSTEQIIVMSTMMEAEIQKYNTVLNELHGSFYKYDASLSLDDKLQEIFYQVNSFAHLNIDRYDAEIQRAYTDREAVYLREVKTVFPSDDYDESTVVAATEVLPDGRLLLCDYANVKIKLFDSNYTAISNIKLSSGPWGMALVNPTDVSLCLPEEKCLQNLKIKKDNTLTLKRKHQTELRYRRVLKYGNKIIAIGSDDGFRQFNIIDTRGCLERRIRKEPCSGGIFSAVYFCCLSPDNSVIYIADDKNGCIGISRNGDVVLKFTDATMKGYKGVCSASGECLYVSASETDNIMMIKSNGEKVKELMRLKGLKPYYITCSKESNILVVNVTDKGVLKVFSLI